MAEGLPPGTPEVDDPLLVADLIRLLSIKGAIGRLPLADIVIPVVSLGDVVTPEINVRQASFRSTDVFSIGQQIAAAVNTVHADTGPLPAGTYDVGMYIADAAAAGASRWATEHRDAANAANLARWDQLGMTGPSGIDFQPVAYELGANERLRILNTVVFAAGVRSVATIFARLRA